MEAPITHVELAVSAPLDRALTDRERRQIALAVQLILDTETVGKPFAAYYHDDGTKSYDEFPVLR